jgi:sodium transport system permease protein
MRFHNIKLVFLKELRETLRDRRSLGMMFGIPLILYPALTVATGGLTASTHRRMAQQTARIAIVNPEAAPRLVDRVRSAKEGLRLIEPADPERALAANEADAMLILPEGFERKALAAEDAEILVRLDRSRTAAGHTQSKVERLLDEYEWWVITERLRARGMPATLVKPLKTAVQDVAPPDRRLGSILGMMLPMMLLFTGMLGAFFPAVNATTSEREMGTLESLLVTPASKMELLLGKAGIVILAGLLAAGMNLVSMSLVMWRMVASMASRAAGGFTLDPGALLLCFVAAIPTIVFFAGLTLVVGLFARNYREANSFATPVMMLGMVPMLVGLADPPLTSGLLATPAVNTTLIIREVLTGRATLTAFLIAFGTSTLYALLMLLFAGRVFSTESLVNPAWEPLSLKGFRRRPGPRPRRLPTPDEALALFAVSLLLMLYISPEWMKLGFIPTVIGNELLLVAAPAVIAAWLLRYRWRETFAWRAPAPLELVGATLMGFGILPLVYALVNLQNRVWPQDPEFTRAAVKMLVPALQQQPILAVVITGALAGICEEVLYRGPVQTGLARRLPAWLTLLFGAFLFAAAHMDMHGLLFRTVIGVVLGWIVLRGGSLFPAILMHAVVDWTHFALLSWAVNRAPAGSEAQSLILAERATILLTSPLALLASAALFALGFWLCWRVYQSRQGTPADPDEPGRRASAHRPEEALEPLPVGEPGV